MNIFNCVLNYHNSLFSQQNGTLKIPIFEIDKGTTLFFRNESAYSKIFILEKLEISGENIKKRCLQ